MRRKESMQPPCQGWGREGGSGLPFQQENSAWTHKPHFCQGCLRKQLRTRWDGNPPGRGCVWPPWGQSSCPAPNPAPAAAGGRGRADPSLFPLLAQAPSSGQSQTQPRRSSPGMSPVLISPVLALFPSFPFPDSPFPAPHLLVFPLEVPAPQGTWAGISSALTQLKKGSIKTSTGFGRFPPY